MLKKNISQNTDLFDQHRAELLKKTAPLADRMRPRTLDEYIGQQHIIGEGRLLRRAIQIDQLSSVIFYGPPGTGKTTLARIIANTTKAQFLSINAVLAGVKEIRESIETAQKTLSLYGRKTILFIDEVHRFNKAQQDALLPHVENGVIILIGATTENPYFEVNKALVSRSRIFQLVQLTDEDLKAVALMAINDRERGYGNKNITIEDDALAHLVKVSNGDARGVLNALELAVETTKPDNLGVIHITRAIAEESIQQRAVLYDKDGDAHYDTISAFIKSVRGSDPDAALYWMSKMLYAGEDPRFIFRRMLILACEDVGLADPHALSIVVSSAQAFDYVGLPEGRYHLAHACLYLATAPKSNSSMAFFDALNTVSQDATDDVPDHLRDSSRDKEGFGHGAGYLYPHAYRDHWVAQQYLPSTLQGKLFYQPSSQGYEKEIAERVTRQREAQLEAMVDTDTTSPLFFAGETSKSQNAWYERSLGSRGRELDTIRKQVISQADLRKTDLVLDLDARTGLLTFEALRHVDQGGVFAIAHNDDAYDTLRKTCERIDILTRPNIILCTDAQFPQELSQKLDTRLKFNAIIGRNVIQRLADKKNALTLFAQYLEKDGRIVLAESIPSEGQRISELLSTREDPSFIDKLTLVELEIYNDPVNPAVNWNSSTLNELLQTIDRFKSKITVHEEFSERTIRPTEIDYWFRKSGENEKSSLGDIIEKLFGPDSRMSTHQMIHKKLDFTVQRWKTVTAIVKIVTK
ncbi:MAG TPA: AAA family ATPase [Chitinispirillaceae bacterium]|nr:AAA family ATPase [Chitinispirillaceae bacterium]